MELSGLACVLVQVDDQSAVDPLGPHVDVALDDVIFIRRAKREVLGALRLELEEVVLIVVDDDPVVAAHHTELFDEDSSLFELPAAAGLALSAVTPSRIVAAWPDADGITALGSAGLGRLLAPLAGVHLPTTLGAGMIRHEGVLHPVEAAGAIPRAAEDPHLSVEVGLPMPVGRGTQCESQLQVSRELLPIAGPWQQSLKGRETGTEAVSHR